MSSSKPSSSVVFPVVAAGLVFTWLVGHFAAASFSDWDAFEWLAAMGAATAYGTLALALVTWTLVAQTRADATGTLELARLAEREQEARERALRRERIECVVDAVDQLVDATIAAEANPNIEGAPLSGGAGAAPYRHHALGSADSSARKYRVAHFPNAARESRSAGRVRYLRARGTA